jgi:DNA mismatch endonuclease (patch repair protein)
MATFNVPPHPGSSTKAVSLRMSVARRRDTKPELQLRRELHRRGRRFRVVLRVPGNNRRTIDIAFTRVKLAVFVDGCFWHGCPEHGSSPAANKEWWAKKLKTNQDRDADTNRILGDAGWTVLRIWEHMPSVLAADRVDDALARLETRRSAKGPGTSSGRPRFPVPETLAH